MKKENKKHPVNLIGISGRIGSGKDTVGKIIQYLVDYSAAQYHHPTTEKDFEDWKKHKGLSKYWRIKKYADKLKDMVCLLIGCTRKQLEDREFKEKELGEEWWHIKKWYPKNPNGDKVFTLYSYDTFDSRIFDGDDSCMWEVIKTTPRLLLQLLGTECGRDIIHPNIWVNALFADYKPEHKQRHQEDTVMLDIGTYSCRCHVCEKRFYTRNKRAFMCNNCVDKQQDVYPNWIITDTRFPNELQAVKDRGGITIRVNRIEKGKTYTIKDKSSGEIFIAKAGIDYRSYDDVVLRCENNFVHRLADYDIVYNNSHSSETALDDYKFDYVIDNNGSIEDLIEKVREILIKEKII